MQATSSKLSETESQQLTEILSNYNTEELSDDDAKTLVSRIQEIGIETGVGLANALNEAGIDAKELGTQAGVGGPKGANGPPGSGKGGGGPQGVESVDDTIVSLVADAVDAYETSDEDSESVWSLLEPALEEAGYDTSVNLIDFYS